MHKPTSDELGALQIGATVHGDFETFVIRDAHYRGGSIILTLIDLDGFLYRVPAYDIGVDADYLMLGGDPDFYGNINDEDLPSGPESWAGG